MPETTPSQPPDPPRLAPTTEADWDDETRALLDSLGRLNIFTTLAHHPKLLKRWMVFGAHILAKSTLPAREREIVILRTGWRCGCAYEFGQHTLIAATVGITEDEISRLATESRDGWPEGDEALVAAADELVDDRRLTDETWARLERDLDVQQVMDLVFTVGQYTLVCMALNSFGVQLDAGVPGFPPSGASPSRGAAPA